MFDSLLGNFKSLAEKNQSKKYDAQNDNCNMTTRLPLILKSYVLIGSYRNSVCTIKQCAY